MRALRRHDRSEWLSRVRDAVQAADGVLEPAAKALSVRPLTLAKWLGEPELRSVPIRGEHWVVNRTHLGVRLERGGQLRDIDVGIVPLIEATWSMEPTSPETCCSCESWPNDGPDKSKVQIGFNVAAVAWMWLDAVDRRGGWRVENVRDECTMRFTRGDWSLQLGTITKPLPCMRAWIYFPRADLADVIEKLSARRDIQIV